MSSSTAALSVMSWPEHREQNSVDSAGTTGTTPSDELCATLPAPEIVARPHNRHTLDFLAEMRSEVSHITG
jgi:hypothetical protein